LVIESHGNVPDPKLEKTNGIVVRRWRVDQSPAAPAEPGSPPITEFLPSVRLGGVWAWTSASRTSRQSGGDGADRSARAPDRPEGRGPAGPKARWQRAQKLYRWSWPTSRMVPRPTAGA